MAAKQAGGLTAPDGSHYVTLVDGAGNLGGAIASAVTSATGTQTSVASSATDVTILAANTGRELAAVYNDSTQVLFLLLAAGTSSNTNYTVQIPAGGYYESPTAYTGIIKGIWASANGNARVTEWS